MINIDKKAEIMGEVQEKYQIQIQELEKSKKKESGIQKKETQRLIDEYTIKIEIINASYYNAKRDANTSVIVADENIMKNRSLIRSQLEVYMQNYFPNEPREKIQVFYNEMVKELKEECDSKLLTKKENKHDRGND